MIRHDSATSHLVLEDLGSEYVVFWDLIRPGPSSALSALPSIAGQMSWFGDLGQAVGRFFALLHSPGTVEAVRRSKATGDAAAVLEHSITRDVVRRHAVDGIPKLLTENGGASEAEADSLYRRVLDDFTRDSLGPIETCFSLGDSHPGCLLISPGHVQDGTVRPAVIDWEFATITGRGPNGDMAQLLSYYHLFLLSNSPEGNEYRVVREFVSRLCRAYAQQSSVSFGEAVPGPDDPRWGLFRSALVLHGREMVNQAVEWKLGDGTPTRDLVRAGLWYLERAGDSVADMLEGQNLALLKDENGGVMLSLFNLSL